MTRNDVKMSALPAYSEFFKRTMIVVAIVATPILIWFLFGVVLTAFGAIILALLLRLGAAPLTRWLALPESIALIVSGLLLFGIIAVTGYLFGAHLFDEFQDVVQRTSAAIVGQENSLHKTAAGNYLLNHITGGNLSLPGILKVSTTFIESVIILLISGAYLAAQPQIYRRGLICLFPPSKHARRGHF